MASFNIEVSSYDSKQGGNESNYTAYKDNKPVNTFYSAVYTISGLKPNSDYDFYVNGTKKNTSVAQGDHSSYVLNGLKKAGTSNFRIAFYIGIQFANLGIGGVNNRFRTELESIKSSAGEDTPLRSDSSGKIKFTFFPSLSGYFTNAIGLGGGGSYWNIKNIEVRGPSAVQIAQPPSPPAPPANPVLNIPDVFLPNKILSSKTTKKKVTTTTFENKFPEDTLASEVSLYFDYIQTFYLDPAQVDNVDTIDLHSIDLFFTKRPNRNANINQSGIQDPGCHIYVCEVENGEPDLRRTYISSKVRLDFTQIASDLNAEVATNFEFINGLSLRTGKTYGIVVNFEDPNYKLGIATRGSKIISGATWGSTAAWGQPGAGFGPSTAVTYTGNYTAGKLYRSSNYGETNNNPNTAESLYKALDNSDLKFKVNIRKYTTSPSTNTIELVNHDYEFVKVSSFPINSLDQSFFQEDLLYVDYGDPSANVFYAASADLFEVANSVAVPPAAATIVYRPSTSSIEIEGQTIQVVSPTEDEQRLNQLEDYTLIPGLQYKTGQTRNLPALNTLESKFILTQNINKINLTSSEANDPIIKQGYHITYATSVSTTDRPQTESLSDLVQFHNIDTGTPFPVSFYYSANSSGVSVRDDDVLVRPVVMYMVDDIDYTTNTVTMVSSDPTVGISANGINYVSWTGDENWSVGDVITVSGGTVNGSITVLDVTPGGNIASLVITNPGIGLPNPPTVTLPGGGQTGTITVTPGAQLVSSITGLRTDISSITNLNVDEIIPNFGIRAKNGTVSPLRINYAHDPSNNNSYTLTTTNQEEIENDSILSIEKYNATLLSRTNELDNSSTLGVSTSEGKSSLISFDISITNPYESPELLSSFASVYTFENLINNDSTNEHLPESGSAASRYISKRIQFAKDRYAEDVRVFSTLWRPQGTNVKFYLKAHNSADEEGFDEKYWTELEIKEFTLEKEFSSLNNSNDLVEYTLGLKPYPEINSIASGTVTLSGTTITSSGPLDLTTAGLANGDIVILFDKEFPETTYIVSRLANTPTASAFEITDDYSTNTSITNAILSVANTSKPYEIFNDAQNNNFARYFTETGDDFLTYDSMSVKAVLLSETSYIIPHVEDIRAIGVSV